MLSRSIILSVVLFLFFGAGESNVRLGLLKYNGGGDWYANPTALPNLIQYCNQQLNTSIAKEPVTVEVGSQQLFNFPFIHMTGHGNVVFSDQEAKNLRDYLIGGGFLHIDDNYGMDPYVRKAMQKVFPEIDFVELPFSHAVYKSPYRFPNGVPKIHEHDGKPAQAFGIFYEGRLVCFYSYQSDLGDGWEDPQVHNDPEDKRQAALKMGANLIYYVFTEHTQ
jgi:hypothetical protein